MSALPRVAKVEQTFPPTQPVDIPATLHSGFATVLPRIKPGAKIAVGIGSRGITNLAQIVAAVVRLLKEAGADPFLFPAMGSHGGATPEGQSTILGDYGINPSAMGAPLRPSMAVEQVGRTPDGVPVFCSVEALRSDGIVLINRIKPHTDFKGTLGSGIIKMSVIGLGKRDGAAAMHSAASRLGHETAIRSMARVMIQKAPLLCGVAILENQRHETARLVILSRDHIESEEEKLLVEARRLMPSLPFEEIDLLIVDRLGKNISGSGMDPNITGRWVDGYSSALARDGRPTPFIRRIFVRDLTPETHGNAIGIGLADVTTTRLVRAMDSRITYVNAFTALTPQCAKIPIHFETDREAIEMAVKSLALPQAAAARIVRIADTLSLASMEISESLMNEVHALPGLQTRSDLHEIKFDSAGNLAQ